MIHKQAELILFYLCEFFIFLKKKKNIRVTRCYNFTSESKPDTRNELHANHRNINFVKTHVLTFPFYNFFKIEKRDLLHFIGN